MENKADSANLRGEVLDAIDKWNPPTVNELAVILRKKRRLQFSDENLAGVLRDLRREGKLDLKELDSSVTSSILGEEFRAYGDLLLIVVSTLILSFVSLPKGVMFAPLRWIIGIPMGILFPGYVIQASVFPGVSDLEVWKRFVLSFGLSIAAIGFYTAILDATPAGITIVTVFPLLALHVLIFSAVGFVRRLGRTRSP